METKDICLYIHTRKDDNGIFYVGIGNSDRPYQKKYRNKYWHNVVNKYDYNITILKTNMTWKEACDLEIKMIAFYGRKDLGIGCLVNMTDGGDGAKGFIHSEETKQKMRENNIKNGIIPPSREGIKTSEETKKKQREKMIGEKNPNFCNGEKMKGQKNGKSKKVICNITNKIYGCVREAAEDIGMIHGTLINCLNGSRPNKTSLRYL